MDKEFSEQSLKALIASEISDAELFQSSSDYNDDRERNYNYYNGIMNDTPPADGWSKFQTRDVSDVMGWTLPGIIRVFTASDRMVDYQPRRPGDEAFTDQASDYANFIFWNDNDGYRILWDATHDSLLLADGIVKTWWDDSEICEYATYTGLGAEELTLLLEDDDVEIVSQKEDMAEVPGEQGMMQIPVYSVKIKRIESRGRIKILTIEPENFLKDRASLTIEEARFLAHRNPHTTRSDLIKMGFDRDIVESLPGNAVAFHANGDDFQREPFNGFSQGDRSTDLIELYECYIKADVNNDGIAETVLAYYAGNSGAGELLDWEIWDDDPCFTQIPCDPVPHRFQSRSLAGEVVDIQQIKTVITRQMLDNAYQVNNPRLDIEAGSVINMDELVNPTVGGIILRKQGNVTPINYNIVPSIMPNALAALEHMDKVTEMRTGVSRSTMALDPMTLQNQTATASNNQRDSSYSQIELIARNQAELGWKKVFSKILKLIVKHQDRARMIRLRDQWVEMDPRQWNAGMDAVINIGLGTGSRDRDMAMLTNISGSQLALAERFTAAGMVKQTVEMLPKIIKTSVKIAEAAGIRNADDFYPEIKPEELAQIMAKAEEQSNQPPPEVQAAQAKIQADMQVQQAKMQGEQQKSQADLMLKQQQGTADMQMQEQKLQMEMQLRREQMAAELNLKREQLVAELTLKREQMAAELELQRESNLIKGANDHAKATSGVHVGGEPG